MTTGLSVKKNMLKKAKIGIGAFETREEDRIHYENAYNVALKSLHFKSYDVKQLLKTLSKKELKHLIDTMPMKNNAQINEKKVKHIANYMQDIQALSIIEDKIQHARERFYNIFTECFTLQYSRPNGRSNFEKFLNDAHTQLEKLNDSDNKMEEEP
jgi:uncharacterized protein YpuA (DUF1002 family)